MWVLTVDSSTTRAAAISALESPRATSPSTSRSRGVSLLSIGASLGAVTLTFQHGWLGVQPGPVEAYVPVMIFAIAFGLSMDYEIFLLSRMHEEWERDRDARRAVTEGLATTGRVVTAAAAIMIVGHPLPDPARGHAPAGQPSLVVAGRTGPTSPRVPLER